MTMIKEKKKNIRDELVRSGMGCCLFAAAATAINVLLLPFARTYYGYSTPIILLVCAASVCAFLFLGRKLAAADTGRLERIARIAVPAYLCALFAIHLAMGYLMEYKPSGDNFMIYTASQMLATDGNFDAYPDFYLYLSRFSNQWGFLLMLSALYKLFFAIGITQMFFPTVLVQALLYSLGMAATLSIARRLRGVRGVLMTLAMLTTCLPIYLAAAVLYTDTFSLPFVMIALYFALRTLDAKTIKGQLINALACALAATVGGQIKMTVAIVLIAATILFILRMKPVRAALCCAVVWLTMGLSVLGVQKAMVGPVLDPGMVAQHNTPTIHWIMMSIPTSRNPYGSDIEDYRQTWTMMEEGAPRGEVMDSIYTRMKDRIYTLRYPNRLALAMMRKNVAAFGDGTFGMTEMLDDSPQRENAISAVVLQDRPYYRVYISVCTGIFGAHLLMIALACLRDICRRDLRAAVLYVVLFGFMLFMLLWEARSRYIFNFVPVMLLLSMGFAARGTKEGGDAQ